MQQSPPCSGCLCASVTSVTTVMAVQRSPRATVTSVHRSPLFPRSPLCNGHLCETFTSEQQSPMCHGHLCCNGYLSAIVTSVQQSPLCDGHLCATFISVQQSPPFNGHLLAMVNSVHRSPLLPPSPLYNVHRCCNCHLSATVTSVL